MLVSMLPSLPTRSTDRTLHERDDALNHISGAASGLHAPPPVCPPPLAGQITLCMNVTMRSITQAVLVLVFMLYASWRLTTVTFIMIPFIMAISSVGVGKCGECVGWYALSSSSWLSAQQV